MDDVDDVDSQQLALHMLGPRLRYHKGYVCYVGLFPSFVGSGWGSLARVTHPPVPSFAVINFLPCC